MSYQDNNFFQECFNKYKQKYEDYSKALFAKNVFPEKLQEAMKYSLFAGGKRVRAVMVLAACEMFGGKIEQALPVATAVEMIHTYSLIHDDLPAMDDDDLRRGLPTNHKVYGEAMAILAGDTLMTYAYEVIARESQAAQLDALKIVELIKEVSYYTGANGMAGGQVLDIEGEGKALSLEELQKIHELKTGAFIKCCIRCGAIVAGANAIDLEKMTKYAHHMGVLFQIVDDILDVISTDKELGKPVGSDDKNHKSTYVSLLGLDAAKSYADQEALRAKDIISIYKNNEFFKLLVDYFLHRTN